MNNWTWDRLRVFDAVARAGSVTAAARSLQMTGSAVSQHLRRLEAEVGHALVERAGRGLRLTHEGTVLAEHARTVAQVVAQAEHDLAGRGELRGTVRIGAVSSVIRGFLLDRLREFTRHHPRVRVHLRDGETVDHLSALHEDALDVVIAESWQDQAPAMTRGGRVTRLLTERIRLVVPAGHRLADRDTVTWAELAGEVWTCCPPGSGAYNALAHLVRRTGAEWEVAYPVADHVTQLGVVAAGLAVACIPEHSLPANSAEIRVLDTGATPVRSIDLITQAGVLPLRVTKFVTAVTSDLDAQGPLPDRTRIVRS
jgi:molybdate transport repressor ModE-like protein